MEKLIQKSWLQGPALSYISCMILNNSEPQSLSLKGWRCLIACNQQASVLHLKSKAGTTSFRDCPTEKQVTVRHWDSVGKRPIEISWVIISTLLLRDRCCFQAGLLGGILPNGSGENFIPSWKWDSQCWALTLKALMMLFIFKVRGHHCHLTNHEFPA